MTGQDFIDKLSEYFDGYGIGSLDVLSRMSKQGRRKAYRHFGKKGVRMSQKTLEDLQRQYPKTSGKLPKSNWQQRTLSGLGFSLRKREIGQLLGGGRFSRKHLRFKY